RLARVVLEGVGPLRLGAGERVVDGGPAALAAVFEHGRVHDPEERPLRLVDEVAAAADLQAGGAEQVAGGAAGAGGEEDRVAGGGADLGGQAGGLLLGQVLGDRAAERAVFLDEHVGQALGAPAARPLLPAVELLAGLGGAAGHDDRAHVLGLEDAEVRAGEVVGHV